MATGSRDAIKLEIDPVSSAIFNYTPSLGTHFTPALAKLSFFGMPWNSSFFQLQLQKADKTSNMAATRQRKYHKYTVVLRVEMLRYSGYSSAHNYTSLLHH